jgi:hypothetical protein
MIMAKYRILLFALLLFVANYGIAQNLSQEDSKKTRFISIQPSTGNYFDFSTERKQAVDTAIVWLNQMFVDSNFSEYQAWLHYQRGRLYYLRKEIPLAKADLEAAMDLQPTYYEALERLSTMSWHHLKNYTKRRIYINNGILAYDQKLALDSTNAQLWYFYAKFLDLDREFSNANNIPLQIKAWEKCVSYDSTLADGWYELSYLNIKNPELRLIYLYKAISLQESWLYRAHILATLKQNIKDDERTLDFLNQSIQLYEAKYPTHTSTLQGYYKSRAEIYAKQKKYDLQKLDLARIKELE